MSNCMNNITRMIIFQHLNPNARLILNVHITLHVYKKNVKTRVTQAPVVLMLSAKSKIIVQYVYASTDL